MGTYASRFAVGCALAAGFLIASAMSYADDDRRRPFFRSSQGQEVVAGSYQCDGTVFTDEQEANVSAGTFLYATSGITSDFFGSNQSSREVPADLDAMAAICERHIDRVLSEVPRICTLGPLDSGEGTFGNGARVFTGFDFSCQGTRDQVIGVIGGFSRVVLSLRLP